MAFSRIYQPKGLTRPFLVNIFSLKFGIYGRYRMLVSACKGIETDFEFLMIVFRLWGFWNHREMRKFSYPTCMLEFYVLTLFKQHLDNA